MFPAAKEKHKHVPKPYEQITHPGNHVHINVKAIPRRCIIDPELNYSSIPLLTNTPVSTSSAHIRSCLPVLRRIT